MTSISLPSGKISEAMVEAAYKVFAGKMLMYDEDRDLIERMLLAALSVPAPGTDKWLGELLAVIHRDGGQYQATHGDEKAVEDAHSILAAAFAAPGTGGAEPFGLTADEVEALRCNGLKPEEIAGNPVKQAKRVRELLHWFSRLPRGSANPKWTRDHAFELAYYIATTDARAPIDTYQIEKEAWLKGVKATHAEREQMLRLGFITKAEFDASTPPAGDMGAVKVRPLEWEEDDNDGRPMWRAIANAGLTYRIYDDGFPDSSVLLCLHHLELGRFSSLELAKAAAQADYESRILSALSSTPVGEMVLAAQDLLASLDPGTLNPEQSNAWHSLSTALASEGGGR